VNTGVLGASFCRPFGALSFLHHYPRLAPWAAFLRRFAAGFGACAPGSQGWLPVLAFQAVATCSTSALAVLA